MGRPAKERIFLSIEKLIDERVLAILITRSLARHQGGPTSSHTCTHRMRLLHVAHVLN
jgi:hypothetical protein